MDINFALFSLWWILYFTLIYSTSDVDSTYVCDETTKKFRCKNGQCISILAKCDFKSDCEDVSDEEDCNRPQCDSSTQFKCKNGKCIAKEYLCDRFDDCYDNSDEIHPDCANKTCKATEFQCRESRFCIELAWKCDGDTDCEHGDDEKDCKQGQKKCSADQFRCNDSECIDIEWKCDEEDDCRDGSDEDGCKYETCKDTEFKCAVHHQCIPHSWRCDNAVDCIDKTDELNCTSKPPKCPSSYIPCNSGTPRCILPSWKCDGNLDCSDGSDELHCDNILNQCPEGEQLCANQRQCVSKDKICDGARDCVDQSDEFNCKDSTTQNSNCPHETHYRCKGDKNVCIQLKFFCDGYDDCPEGEDEKKGSHFCDYNECGAFNGNCSHKCRDKKFGYQCTCPDGYKLINGSTCFDIDECETSSTCDQGCLNVLGKYKCYCYSGYLLDAATMKCKPSDVRQISLLVADKRSIAKINLHSFYGLEYLYQGCQTHLPHRATVHQSIKYAGQIIMNSDKPPIKFSLDIFHEIVVSNISKPSAIAIDQDQHFVYWTDTKDEIISRSKILPHKKAKNISSKEKKEVLLGTEVLDTPQDIAIDWTHRHLYWTDSVYRTVSVSYLNGSYPTTLFEVDMHNYLSGIAVHPQNGFLFISRLTLLSPSGIDRYGMDGSAYTRIVTQTRSWPIALTIDISEDRLYWIDSRLAVLASSDLNGQHQQNVFYSLQYISSPSSISAFSGQIYWTELEQGLVLNIDKSGKDLRIIDHHIHLPSAVEVYHPEMQVNTTNYCHNSPCKFMCLPRPTSDDTNSLRYSCVCPDHYTTSPDDANDCIKIMPTKTSSTSNKTITASPSTLKTTSTVSSVKTTSTVVTSFGQDITTSTMNASHRIDTSPVDSGISNGAKVFIGLGVIALLVLTIVIMCYVLRWHKQRTERRSMNFNNPIYRKVAENSRNDSFAGLDEQSSVDMSGIEPTTSSPTADLVLSEELPDVKRERRNSNDSTGIIPQRNGHVYSKVKTNEDQDYLLK